MILTPEARSGRIDPHKTEGGLACSGRLLSLGHRQRHLRQQGLFKRSLPTSAAAFKPCIDIHQASSNPELGAYSSEQGYWSGTIWLEVNAEVLQDSVCCLQGRVKQIVGSSLKDLPKLRQGFPRSVRGICAAAEASCSM